MKHGLTAYLCGALSRDWWTHQDRNLGLNDQELLARSSTPTAIPQKSRIRTRENTTVKSLKPPILLEYFCEVTTLITASLQALTYPS